MTTSPELEQSPLAPKDPEVLVSVLIPFLDEERYLPSCVPAMQAQKVDGDVEFLFIDGRSEDRSREILNGLAASDPRIRVLDNPARRTAAGLNIGLRAARGRYVARMDAHSVYPECYLQRGITRLERGGVDWVTGPQIPDGRGRWSEGVALALRSWIGRGESDKWPGAVERGGSADDEFDLKTSVFVGVWRRETLDALGGWDEGWPVNQDAEMAARVLAKGGRIVCRPDMGAQYVPRNTLRGLGRQYGRYGYYRSKTFLRHPESLPKSRWFPVAVLGSIAASFAPWRQVRVAGVMGVTGYVAGVAFISAGVAKQGERDAVLLPPIFVAMHLSWAVGFVIGLALHAPRRRQLLKWPSPLERR